MKRYIKQLGICLLAGFVVLFNRCEDEQLVGSFSVTELPEVSTDNVTNITSSSASCGGNVIFDGGSYVYSRGVCWSTSPNPTVSDSHTMNNSGTGSFISNLTGLTANKTYYVRAYATNSIGTSYGEQKSFKTKSTSQQQTKWLMYDDGTNESNWGYTNGGNDEWAVMFPSSMLYQYDDISVSQINAYYDVPGTYVLKIYEGTYYTTSTTLLSKTITVSSKGWKTTTFSPVSVSNNKCIWVSLSKSYEAGEHPNCAAAGINNPNARWKKNSSGSWYDVCDNNGGVDLTWMIRAYISYYSNKSGKMEEVELSQIQDMDNSKVNPETRRSL